MSRTMMAVLSSVSLFALGACGEPTRLTDSNPEPAEYQKQNELTDSNAESVKYHPDDIALGDCTLRAWKPNGHAGDPMRSWGEIDCPRNESVEVQVCMQQLITGGWQTMEWSCVTHSPPGGVGDLTGVASQPVPYYTNGRWYRTWAWGYASGATNTTLSNTCKGNGASGCN